MEQTDKPVESPPDEGAERAGHDFRWLFWAGVVFAVYLLAFGPAVKLHRAVPEARRPIEAMYFWLEPLARSCPQFDAAVDWYVHKVWRVK